MAGRSHNVAGAGHHPRQAVRDGGGRAAGGVRAAGGPARAATRCAASRARSAPRRTCWTCSAATRRSWPTWSSGSPGTSASRRAFTSVGQVYPRSLDYDVVTRAGAAGRGAVVAGQDDPADGRARAGHRGLQAGPGRLLRDAAQDEHPLLRAGQRADGDPARLRLDDRRAGGRPVERGRRVVLGGAPGRAAGRLLRLRRAAGDVPDRARRVRRLPGRRSPANWTATCRSWRPPRC